MSPRAADEPEMDGVRHHLVLSLWAVRLVRGGSLKLAVDEDGVVIRQTTDHLQRHRHGVRRLWEFKLGVVPHVLGGVAGDLHLRRGVRLGHRGKAPGFAIRDVLGGFLPSTPPLDAVRRRHRSKRRDERHVRGVERHANARLAPRGGRLVPEHEHGGSPVESKRSTLEIRDDVRVAVILQKRRKRGPVGRAVHARDDGEREPRRRRPRSRARAARVRIAATTPGESPRGTVDERPACRPESVRVFVSVFFFPIDASSSSRSADRPTFRRRPRLRREPARARGARRRLPAGRLRANFSPPTRAPWRARSRCVNLGSFGNPSGHTLTSVAYAVVMASPAVRPKLFPPAYM